MPEDEQFSIQDYKKIAIVTIVAVVLLCIVTVGSYLYAKRRTGSTILPGGVTYLGPTPTPPVSTVLEQSIIVIPKDATWNPYKGKIFPYSFMYPNTLSLGVFPNDPFDGVTIFYNDTNPQENIFLRVEDLNKLKDMASFINKSKKDYANVWWKQYNWKGVGSLEEFTNSNGIKGYRAKYLNDQGQTPFDNIFFEVPGRSDLVVWMGNKLLDPSVFDRIVDSFNWNTKG